jgi:hypothetical protein
MVKKSDAHANIKTHPYMNKRTFFIWAVLLALIALVIHATARSFLDDAMHREGARLEQVMKQHIAYIADPQATRSNNIYNTLTIIGIALTVLSFVCMLAASTRHESGWYLLLIMLLLCDIVLPVLL